MVRKIDCNTQEKACQVREGIRLEAELTLRRLNQDVQNELSHPGQFEAQQRQMEADYQERLQLQAAELAKICASAPSAKKKACEKNVQLGARRLTKCYEDIKKNHGFAMADGKRSPYPELIEDGYKLNYFSAVVKCYSDLIAGKPALLNK